VRLVKSLNPRLAAALMANNAAGFVTHFAVAKTSTAGGYSSYAATLSVASLLGVVHLAMQNNAQHNALDGAAHHRRGALVLAAAVAVTVMLSSWWWAEALDLPVIGASAAVIAYFFAAAYASTVRGEVMARDPANAAGLMAQSAVLRVVGALACALWHPVAGVVGLGVGELVPVLRHRRVGRHEAARESVASSHGAALFWSVVAHAGVFVAFYSPVFAARARLGDAAAAGFAFSSALVGGQLSLAYATAWPAVNAGANVWASARRAAVVSGLVGVPVAVALVAAPRVLAFEAIGAVGALALVTAAIVAAPAIVMFQVLLRAKRGVMVGCWLAAVSIVVVVSAFAMTDQRQLALVTLFGSALMLGGLMVLSRQGDGVARGGVCHVVTQRFDRHEAVCKTVLAIAAELGEDQHIVAPGVDSGSAMTDVRLWAPLAPLWPKARRVMRASSAVVVHGGPLAGLTALLAPRRRIVVHVYASMKPVGAGWWWESHRTKAGPVRALLSAGIGWPLLRVLLRTGKVAHVVCASEEISENLREAGSVSVVCVAPVDEILPQARWRSVPHVFFAGRAEATRGVCDVIAAVAELHRRGVKVDATIAVRSGRDLDEVARMAEETPGVVLLAGDSERLLEEMRRATIGVWPFRTEATVTPATTTVEAAMVGLPVVSSTVACCATVSCEQVLAGDVTALADTIWRLHASEEVWNEAAKASRTAAEGLTVRRHAEILDEMYRGGTNCSGLGACAGSKGTEEEN
jgi:glycosyltransferase involved in cell wall biosynthesis